MNIMRVIVPIVLREKIDGHVFSHGLGNAGVAKIRRYRFFFFYSHDLVACFYLTGDMERTPDRIDKVDKVSCCSLLSMECLHWRG